MPDRDEDHGPLSSVQPPRPLPLPPPQQPRPHHLSERRSSHQSHQSSHTAVPHLQKPLDDTSTLTSSLTTPATLLPATAYVPQPLFSSRQRPQPAERGNENHAYRPSDGITSDPREFYRSYTTDALKHAQKTSSNIGSILPAEIENGMTTVSSTPRVPLLSSHTDPSQWKRSPPIRSSQFRSFSGGSNIYSDDNLLRSQPVLSTGARSRQSSLKDLVNRFNQTVDEVPPVPLRTSSRTTSRAVSPSGSSSGEGRRPDSSLSRISRRQTEQDRPPIVPNPSLSRVNTTLPFIHHTSGFPGQRIADTNGATAQSRQPLFGELLTFGTAVSNPGYGISSHVRRRGSDSSVPSTSPNSFCLEKRVDLETDLSPSSPTAWYLGYSPSLEAVAIRSDSPGRTHRRSRSDASWNTSKPAVTSSLSTHMAVASARDLTSAVSPDSPHSKSRIPIACRRLSHASDSGNSSPSTRANSAMGLHYTVNVIPMPLAPKGSSRLPKLSAKSPVSLITTSPIISPRVPPAVKSPTRRDTTRGHGISGRATEKGSLTAYISAPPPKKSPPLRSSRPRQPVSTATTSASRAKVVDRVSHFQSTNPNDDDFRNPRSRTRRLPELGNVDFEARRQKIQQAFNKSVRESAKKAEEAAERRRLARYKKDEEVRSQLLREGELRKMASVELSSPNESTLDDRVDSPGSEPMVENEVVNTTIALETHVPTAGLTIDTSLEDAQKSPQLFTESPILGESFSVESLLQPAQNDADASDIPPLSAVTAETNDTDITRFDPEPQTDLQDPDSSHRTILNRIMQLRESSSSSECDDEDENDEKESIQIMLEPNRCTFYFESMDSGDSNGQEAPSESHDAMADDDQLRRWSMASWSSSLRDQQSLAEDNQIPWSETTQELTHQRLSVNDSLHHEESSSIDEHNHRRSHENHIHWSEETQLSTHQHTSPAKPVPGSSMHRKQRSQPESLGSTLIRQGGWDSKRVTQLYLEELTRGRFRRSLERPWDLTFPDDDTEVASKPDSLTDDPIIVPRVGELASSDYVTHRASLSLRADWESASPSIADWMQVAAGDVPPPPPKSQDDVDLIPRDNARTPVAPTSHPAPSRPDSSWDGLGLAIHVDPPVDQTSVVPTPPLPNRSPPPPPAVEGKVQGTGFQPPPQAVSPSVYASQPPSSILPSVPFTEDYPPVRHSEDSYLTRAALTPSPRTVASSATSQHQVAAAPPSVEIQSGSPTPEQRRLKKRRHVVKELVDTEHTFGRDMKVVDDIYKGTSSSCLDLSADDVRTLFGNSDQVVQFSMNFQDALKQAVRSVYVMPKSQRWSSKRGTRSGRGSPQSDSQSSVASPDMSDLEQDNRTFIGQVFMESMAQMEKVYADYLKNHDAANKKLQVLQRNPKVAIWLKECHDWASDLTAAWDLDSLLVKPVQRILKYPLLLAELIESTPQDHPDHAALLRAVEGVTNISVRINELKKRADMVGQVVSSRKRKESDVRTGLSKAFGRRTEKLKQQVGLSEIFEDKEYDALAQRFGDSFFQLQVVMRDAEMYSREIQAGMERFNEFAMAIEGCIDVAQSNYTELESKWHRMRMAVREVINVALPEHVGTIRKSVINPMITLLKLYEGPQKVMQKRTKRLIDYARFKAIKDRGDRPDKKTTEQGEQFSVLNDALRDELPKLFALTAKLMEACLNNFVEIQMRWFSMLQKKLSFLLDHFPTEIGAIVNDWSGDFTFADAQMLSLGLCNGALLSEAINLVHFNTPDTGATSPRRPSTVTNSSTRTPSITLESSPKLSYDISNASGSFQSPSVDGYPQQHPNGSQTYLVGAARRRTNSSMSVATRTGGASDAANGQVNPSAAVQGILTRPSTGSEPFPCLPRLSLDMPFMNESLLHGTNHYGPTTSETTASPSGRYSGFFSSAMPMSDSPRQERPSDIGPSKDPKVLFLAASLYEFNIDRARREAGYPYLTYVAGEIFDIIAEKGELWLARNQDDSTHLVGWIWTKHFAKLSS